MFSLISWPMEMLKQGSSDLNPVDSFCQGLVGACGVSVLYNLTRVHNFTQACNNSRNVGEETKPRSNSSEMSSQSSWRAALQFWCLTLPLSLVGPRVSSLIVLEFSLRAVLAYASARMDAGARGLDLLLIQCQFSLGCSLSCTLAFLHQGAPHSSLSLLLAAALSWKLASYCSGLWRHVAKLYPLHSTQRYCGKCINLLTGGHTILPSLQGAVVLAFAIAGVASSSTVYEHFLSQKDVIKFWIPLTLCYAMLVVLSQGDEDHFRQTSTLLLLHVVVIRLGGLLVLMLTMGEWSDVLHVLISFLGEGVCLLSSHDLLETALEVGQEGSSSLKEEMPSSSL